jgi:aminopeptidase-like protein
MLEFIHRVWNYQRSLTGDGLRNTLKVIQEFLPELRIQEVPTGTRVWDWKIPKEWQFDYAVLKHESGRTILDSKENFLHIVNYSKGFKGTVDFHKLQKHLYSNPVLPGSIPYRTSYYKPNWGFCISHENRQKLLPGRYHVDIKARHFNGSMSIASIHIPGRTKKEIFFSTYVCHPNLANNELSGPAVAVALAQYLSSRENYYSYRFLFAPETIGSLYFLSRNLPYLKKNCIAGYVLTCLGDNDNWSYLPSRTGMTVADKVAKRVLNNKSISYKEYSFMDRGSDERQYCSPRIDLPFCSVMRSKYGTYLEYHNSYDDLTKISKIGLNNSLNFFKELTKEFEKNRIPFSRFYGEPMFSKRGIRSATGGGILTKIESHISNFIAYSDGSNDLTELQKILQISKKDLSILIDVMNSNKLISYQ